MKKLLLIIFITIGAVACKPRTKDGTVWTPSYEQDVYRQIDVALQPRFSSSVERAKMVNYTIARLKKVLPNGLSSIPADSLERLSRKIGVDYGLTHADEVNKSMTPSAVAWTSEFEQSLRESILKGMNGKGLKDPNGFCDCVILKLKKIYPQNITLPLPADITRNVAKDCINETNPVATK